MTWVAKRQMHQRYSVTALIRQLKLPSWVRFNSLCNITIIYGCVK